MVWDADPPLVARAPVGWRSGAERACARRWRCHRFPPARLLPGVARANSTGVGMRMICDVNWDTHRAHTHVYRSTTDCDDAPRSGGIRLDVSLDPRCTLPGPPRRSERLIQRDDLGQRPAFKSPRHRGTSRVQGVAFNTLLGLPGLPLVCVPQAEAPLVITHQINDKKHK